MIREKLNAALADFAAENGYDEECGDLNEPPYKKAGLLRDAFDVADMIDDEEVDDAALAFLRNQAGLVLITDRQDRVTVKFFETEDELEDYWEDLSADIDAESDEVDDEDEAVGEI